jgi:hypothetical protein
MTLRLQITSTWLLPCLPVVQQQHKNNDRLNRRLMQRFRRTIDVLQIAELHLNGRLYTWSNERSRPTLERIDHVFATVPWLADHPFHSLHCRSTDCSDHAPLLLILSTEPWAQPRFRFESFWPTVGGFLDVVASALDYKLRNVAKALKNWSAQRIGSVRFQLAVARVVIFELDVAQETRLLSPEELELRRELKAHTLGLSSLSRTIARHKSRYRYLKDGDANTKFFHLQSCHRKRKSYIPTFMHEGRTFTSEEAKSEAVFDYYNTILGTRFHCLHRIDLDRLDLPRLDLQQLAAPFTETEIARIVHECPADRAPGPDGFTARFYRAAWPIIKFDICSTFQALWQQDWRSFYLLNDASMCYSGRRRPRPASGTTGQLASYTVLVNW